MLKLRRATVVSIQSQDDRIARLTARLTEGGSERPAIAYPTLTGPVTVGDDLVVNVEAQDLGLGSGGFDIVHANLSRLDGGGAGGDAHVMKLNYSSLQHAVEPIEQGLESLALGVPVAVMALHGQLAAVAYAYSVTGNGRLGYIQTIGGALPGALSDVAAELLDRGLLAGHITAGASFGGQHESITVEGAIDGARQKLNWDAAVLGPGPGIIGSASALGHGGMAALSNAHAALSLGCSVVVVPRVSSGDPRDRHHGVSHHTTTVLGMLLGEVAPVEPGLQTDELIEGYRVSGLPMTTMGRAIDQDLDFFRYALAAGATLAQIA